MEKVLPEYAIDTPLECSFFARGANDTYLVRTPKTRYFMRVCRSGAFPREALEFEAEAVSYLHKKWVFSRLPDCTQIRCLPYRNRRRGRTKVRSFVRNG
jgi:Ser/Thr protein kinase RdoA (MazF antagonist)